MKSSALKDSQTGQFAHKYRLDMQPPRVFEGGIEYMVSQKDFPIQSTFTAVKMILQPGALREMHWHPHADEWQYYLSGQARMTVFGSHGRIRTEDYSKGQRRLRAPRVRPLYRAGRQPAH